MIAREKKAMAVMAAVAGLAAGIALFYGRPAVDAAESPAMSAPQAMPVEVTVIRPQPVQIWKNFSGHLVAVDQAEIRPQVSGRITEIRFEDGQHVEKGHILLVIDPRPYEAALNQAKAELAAAQTRAGLAEKEYQRALGLIKTDAISKRLMDERINERDVAAAMVKGAKAAAARAEIDLDYAYVKAPIAGKVSRAEITEGNLVQAGPSAPLLTSIVSDAEIYADFEVDDQTYIACARSGGDKDVTRIPVRLSLPGVDTVFEGHIHSFDNRIDASTGTVRARALFKNDSKILLPGMSVTVLMGSAGAQERIVVSERAIGTDQDRKFVYVVNGDNKAAYREIKIGDSVDGSRVVLAGLEDGDMVITEGVVRIRPDMPVDPKIAEDQAAAPAILLPPEEAARESVPDSMKEQ